MLTSEKDEDRLPEEAEEVSESADSDEPRGVSLLQPQHSRASFFSSCNFIKTGSCSSGTNIASSSAGTYSLFFEGNMLIILKVGVMMECVT
jgi:hypothetical protein